MEPKVDAYLAGAKRWRAESERLRAILLDAGLDETLKWRKPCYAHEGNNIAIIQPFRGCVALMFFKGALLERDGGALRDVGPNSRSARRLEMTSVEEVDALEETIHALVREAVEVEAAGLSVPKDDELVLVEELRARLDADPALKAAFEGLTPGRQRAYNLHVGGAKRSETRARRVEKHAPAILAGKGLRD